MNKNPKLAVIVLAAGLSRRAGSANKLLSDFLGATMIWRTLKNVPQNLFAQSIVVTGYEDGKIEQALAGLQIQFIFNSQFESGMASSLKAGFGALDGDIDAGLVMLGDMPLVRRETIEALLEAYETKNDICVPYFDDKRGNPVLWGRAYFEEITSLYGVIQGDVGAKALLEQHKRAIKKISVDDQGVLRDFDTFSSLPIMHTNLDADKKP